MSQNILWTLKRLHLAMEQYGKLRMHQADLTPTQAAVLCDLLAYKERGNCGVDLHTRLGISKSCVSATLKALKQKGYLCLKENPTDDRKKQIILTQKAYDAEGAIHAGVAAQQDLLCRRIPRQRLEGLARDLEQMLRNLQTEMEQEAKL